MKKLKSFAQYFKNIWINLTIPDDIYDLMSYIDDAKNICSECEFKTGYCSLCPVTHSIKIKKESCNSIACKDVLNHFPKQFFDGCASI